MSRTHFELCQLPFPPGWAAVLFEHENYDTRCVFVDHAAQTTTWRDPRLDQLLGEELNAPKLPSDWQVNIDDEGEPYFVNVPQRASVRRPHWLTPAQHTALNRFYEEVVYKPGPLPPLRRHARTRTTSHCSSVISSSQESQIATSTQHANNSTSTSSIHDSGEAAVAEHYRQMYANKHNNATMDNDPAHTQQQPRRILPVPPSLRQAMRQSNHHLTIPIDLYHTSTDPPLDLANYTAEYGDDNDNDNDDDDDGELLVAGKRRRRSKSLSARRSHAGDEYINILDEYKLCPADYDPEFDGELLFDEWGFFGDGTQRSLLSKQASALMLDLDSIIGGAAPLPLGWESHLSEDGTTYYAHPATKRVTWTHPVIPLRAYGLEMEALPPEWDIDIDEDGLFFMNHDTQLATRFPPPDIVAIAPHLQAAFFQTRSNVASILPSPTYLPHRTPPSSAPQSAKIVPPPLTSEPNASSSTELDSAPSTTVLCDTPAVKKAPPQYPAAIQFTLPPSYEETRKRATATAAPTLPDDCPGALADGDEEESERRRNKVMLEEFGVSARKKRHGTVSATPSRPGSSASTAQGLRQQSRNSSPARSLASRSSPLKHALSRESTPSRFIGTRSPQVDDVLVRFQHSEQGRKSEADGASNGAGDGVGDGDQTGADLTIHPTDVIADETLFSLVGSTARGLSGSTSTLASLASDRTARSYDSGMDATQRGSQLARLSASTESLSAIDSASDMIKSVPARDDHKEADDMLFIDDSYIVTDDPHSLATFTPAPPPRFPSPQLQPSLSRSSSPAQMSALRKQAPLYPSSSSTTRTISVDGKRLSTHSRESAISIGDDGSSVEKPTSLHLPDHSAPPGWSFSALTSYLVEAVSSFGASEPTLADS